MGEEGQAEKRQQLWGFMGRVMEERSVRVERGSEKWGRSAENAAKERRVKGERKERWVGKIEEVENVREKPGKQK